MDFLQSFDKYSLNEAIELSVIKPYIQAWKDDGGEEMYKELFGGKYRLYLDLESEKSDLQKEVEKVLDDNGYIVVDYFKNKAKKKGDDKNEPKIGKLLNRFAPTLAPQFAVDKDKAVSSEYKVVVSRHPYDIVGMSTDRRWHSCMAIDGANRHYLWKDIKFGTLVAYVIKKDDTNLKDPINRILIKPFVNEEGESILSTDYKVYFDEKGGDKEIVGFIDTVDKWLDNNQVVGDTTYRIHDELYPDGKNYAISKNVIKKLEREYDSFEVDESGYISVSKNGLVGMVNSKGNLVVPAEFEGVDYCHNSYYIVSNNSNQVGVYDSTLKNMVISFDKIRVQYLKEDIFRIYDTLKRNTYLYNVKTGNKTKSFTSFEISDNSILIWFTNSDEVQIVSDMSLEKISPMYRSITQYNPSQYIVSKDGKYGVYNVETHTEEIPVIHDVPTLRKILTKN
jgi:hypothetical protein